MKSTGDNLGRQAHSLKSQVPPLVKRHISTFPLHERAVAKRCGRGTNENQAAAQSLMQLHQRCWSLRLSCWQPFTMVLKSEAAILCASPSDRLENTFCSAGTITLEKYRFLNEKAMFLVSARGKNVIRRPQLRYGKPIRSLRRSSPDRPRIKPRNATLFERRQISFFASADLLRYIQDSRVCENSPIKLQTLGMTKGRAALPCTAAKQTLGEEEGGVFVGAYLATTIYGSVTLPLSSRAQPRDLRCAPAPAQRSGSC